MKFKSSAENLLKMTQKCTSPFHTVKTCITRLTENDFEELTLKDEWNLQSGGKYFVNVFDSTLIAFTIGERMRETKNIRIATAHTDFPAMRIKSNPEISDNGYLRLNVEMYGGGIKSTFMDRPLSLAGRVTVKSENIFEPKTMLVDLNKPVLIIPNIAIHLNHDINNGYKLNIQKDMLPICALPEEGMETEDIIKKEIAKALNIVKEDILDMELVAYQYEKGEIIGFDNSMISSPRLDNITSVESCMEGIINAQTNKGINVVAMFDNEEIGSGTKQGAGSLVLSNVLEKIYVSMGSSRENYLSDLSDGILISADVAHCLHPNYVEKNDMTSKAILNQGVVIKKDSKQKYANDGIGVAIVKGICENSESECQEFMNHSDGTSGSTLGSIISKTIPMDTIDVGVPLLAMHSARELMGIKDQYYLNELIKGLFNL